MRPNVKQNGELYYEYVAVYVDDILVVAENPKQTMDCLAKLYRLKEGSVGKPSQYLGAQIMEHRFPEEPQFLAWAMSSARYVKEAVCLVDQERLKMNNASQIKFLRLYPVVIVRSWMFPHCLAMKKPTTINS